MSALAALFNRDGSPASRDKLDRMLRSLAIFGGDGTKSGHYGPVAMGTCLRWTTPEDVGKPQPVPSRDGRFAMVFEGRIDNREELGEALGLSEADLRALSDAQLMMRGYEQWGEDMFIRAIAEFCLILWDERDERLMLVTDPMGVRGIMTYATDACFYAATMPRGLHALPEIPRELNEEKIADALCQLLVDPTKTAFEGITAVPGGSIMTVRAGSIDTRRYYRMADHVKPIRYDSDEEYVEAAKALFDTAVKARLRTQHPIGALMSGGLDSSTVAVSVSRYLEQQGTRLPTFTSVPQDGWDGQTEPHCYGDETPYVRAIAAQHPNIELNLVKAPDRGHYYRQDEFLRLTEMPMRNAALMGWMHTIMEDAKSRGIRVMMVGDSGNMTLSYRGDGIYFDLFKRGRWVQMLRELWAMKPGMLNLARSFYVFVFSGLFTNEGWERLMRLRGRPTLEERWPRYSTALKSFGEKMRIPQRARASTFDYFGRPPIAGRAFWRESMEEMTGGLFPYAKAFIAMHNMEMRDPLGDRRLVEWCFGVPEEQFHRKGSPRWMIKRVMQGILPDEVLHKKLLVGRINSDWQVRLAKDLPRMREDLVAMRDDPDLSRMVDIDRLEAWIDDWPDHTVTAPTDDRRFTLGVNLPMAMNAARFVELVKGRNR